MDCIMKGGIHPRSRIKPCFIINFLHAWLHLSGVFLGDKREGDGCSAFFVVKVYPCGLILPDGSEITRHQIVVALIGPENPGLTRLSGFPEWTICAGAGLPHQFRLNPMEICDFVHTILFAAPDTFRNPAIFSNH